MFVAYGLLKFPLKSVIFGTNGPEKVQIVFKCQGNVEMSRECCSMVSKTIKL